MTREPSLTRAIAKAKRDTYKYGVLSSACEACYAYFLREDELPVLVEEYNEWLLKEGYYTITLEELREQL